MKKETAIIARQEMRKNPNAKEIVIREGAADKIYEDRIINISGTIDAPRRFFDKRKEDHNVQGCMVKYSRDKMEIILICDERNHFHTTISGKMDMNPDLEKYGINKDKIFAVSDLQQFLRMRRSHFVDRDQNAVIVNNLSRFKASVSVELEQQKGTRGEEVSNFERKVKTDLLLNFTLEMQVFKGLLKKKFEVEICFEIRDKAITVWLESPELQEIMDTEKNLIIDEELKTFTDLVIIEQ